MAGYLRLKDYDVQTQQEFNQVIANDDSLRILAEAQALEEVKSYLMQKYDISKEFAEITTYKPTIAYNALDRVEISLSALGYSAYSPASTYSVNDKVINGPAAYYCKTAITVPEAFNLTKWAKIGKDGDLYHGALPYPEFHYKTFYSISDQAFWKNFTYIALKESVGLSHDGALQIGTIELLPNAISVAPDSKGASAYWGSKTAYTIPAGTPPGSSFWTFGDSRNPKIVQVMIDIVIYTLWSRAAPRNIPPSRIDRYRQAINWLEMIATGQVSTSLDIIQPSTGNRIRFGGDVKNYNGY